MAGISFSHQRFDKRASDKDGPLRLTNSFTWKREEFKTAKPGEVLFYSCGPTVYGPLHIGNARALFTGDLFYRWLQHIGYKVNFVRNYTDVDDKIINRAKDENTTSEAVAEKYIEYCETDMKLMGLGKPTRTVKVTESMADIISLIENIIKNGHAYVVDGEVLFSIETFPEYGKLSGKKIEELQAGARVEVGDYKKNPLDFSLWKKAKPGEPAWDSPWGKGRPGWHIECSAMIRKHLGDTIDLHHGGQDLIFPHHENEIAQSECGTGKTFCAHWVHNAFLTVGSEKMSKSLGNIFEIRKFVEAYGGEVLRYEFIRHHYRSAFDFNDETLLDTLTELERVYEAKRWAEDAMATDELAISGTLDDFWKELLNVEATGKSAVQNCLTNMENEMFNDVNTPGAVAQLFTLIRAINGAEAKSGGRPGMKSLNSPARKRVAEEFLALLNGEVKAIFNVFGEPAESYLKHIADLRKKLRPATASSLSDAQIEALLAERLDARKNKNFARADEIRKQLDASGILILDGPTGTTWKQK